MLLHRRPVTSCRHMAMPIPIDDVWCQCGLSGLSKTKDFQGRQQHHACLGHAAIFVSFQAFHCQLLLMMKGT